MKRIFIVGGDGFARECYFALSQQPQFNKEICFGGFLGHGGYGSGVDYKSVSEFFICEVTEFNFCDDDYVIIGAAYPSLRSKIYKDLKQLNVKYYNLITADSIINSSASIGECNIIISALVSADTIIGDGNVFNYQSVVGHDACIGNFNFLGPRSQILGCAILKDYNQIGAGTVVLPKAKLGSNNIIAPLSAVYKGCKNNKYLMGNPALNVGQV